MGARSNVLISLPVEKIHQRSLMGCMAFRSSGERLLRPTAEGGFASYPTHRMGEVVYPWRYLQTQL